MKKTPNNKIRAALRKLWLQSRERSQALKEQNYTCQNCGVKQTQKKGQEVKVEVHHKEGVGNWEHLIEEVRKHLLCDPSKLQVLCKECHKNENTKK